jgi:hypothetical protein
MEDNINATVIVITGCILKGEASTRIISAIFAAAPQMTGILCEV